MPHTVPALLRQLIAEHGAISLATYMETCLYAPGAGYYQTQVPFGTEGDFTTAPEISQLFGEMVAVWLMDAWQKAGQPNIFSFIEIGPGRGTLMADILRTIQQVLPTCYAAAQVHMVEVSTLLTREQRRTLHPHIDKISWHRSLETIKAEDVTFTVGNELFDALPVQQFLQHNGAWHERVVTLDANQNFSLSKCPAQPAYTPPNAVTAFEYAPALAGLITQVQNLTAKGAALFIDYGAEAYGHTLQAVQNHKPVDIFHQPGQSDLTAHVNFAEVASLFGAGSLPLATMSGFLVELGLPVRAAKLLQVAQKNAERAEIEQAAFRLLHPEQMGTLFKAFCWHRNMPQPAGFSHVGFEPQAQSA